MGEHGTWFDYLNRFEWWKSFQHWSEHTLGRKWTALVFAENGFTLTHVLVTILMLCIVIAGGAGGTGPASRSALRSARMTPRNPATRPSARNTSMSHGVVPKF